jgi:acyl-CoA dehydrogenase
MLLVLEQQGRRVAPVPFWSTVLLGALPIAEFGRDAQLDLIDDIVAGRCIAAAALDDEGSADPARPASTAVADGERWRLHGVKPAVAFAPVAHLLVVSASTDDGTGLLLVDPDAAGVTVERIDPTGHTSAGRVTLDGAPADRLGGADALDWVLARARVGLAALQVGISEEAVRMTAEYVSEREQFDKPLSTNQGVALRAADAYIATEAIRTTLWQAAWRLSEGLEAEAEVLAAAWWTGEGGHEILHATQHLHGGLGSDIDYPVHRYFIRGKQIGDTLGGPSATAATLGDVLATRAKARA